MIMKSITWTKLLPMWKNDFIEHFQYLFIIGTIKRCSGGLWTNACCSHPRKGEETREATIRRMKQELGLSFMAEEVDEAHLQELGSFLYYKKFESCAEHEIDHVFYLSIDKENLEFDLDPEEIAEIKWISIPELKKWLAEEPESFSAWFPTGFKMVCEKIC